MPVAEKRKRSRRPRRPRQSNTGETVQVLYEAPPREEKYGSNIAFDDIDDASDDVADNVVYDDADDADDDYAADDNAVYSNSSAANPIKGIASFLSSREALTAVGAVGALAIGWLIYKSLSNKDDGDDPGDPLDPPIVSPSRKVVLDPWGEGNKQGMDDAGRAYACLANGVPPLWYTGATTNLFIAKAIGKYLKRAGYPFKYVREGDEELPLPQKVSKIVEERPAVLVAIRHSNFPKGKCPAGSAVTYPSGPSDISMRSKQLAELIGDNLRFSAPSPPYYMNTVRFVAAENEADGMEEEYFRLLRQSGSLMPISVIVDPSPLCNCLWQGQFKQSYEDRNLRFDDLYASLFGGAVVNAIKQYFNLNA